MYRLRLMAARVRALLAHLHPRRLPDTVKKIFARFGMMGVYWHLRAFFLQLAWGIQPRAIANTVRWLAACRRDVKTRRRDKRLTVAVDISPLWEPLTGIGWYLYRLLEHLADRDDLELRLYGPTLVESGDLPQPVITLPTGPAIHLVTWKVPRDLSFSWDFMVRCLRALQPRLIAADRNDLLFAPNYFLPPSFRRARGRLVVTVHDLGFERVPETLRESTRHDLARHLDHTLERATQVLTDTETVRAELLASGRGLDPSSIHAVHLGPGPVVIGAGDDDPAHLPEGTPARYGLFVGTLEPRKDLPTLIAAWRELRATYSNDGEPPALVLCGRWGWKTERLEAAVRAGRDEGWLHTFGYLADAEVAALYRHASLVALPSIYEGFGLPVVEAQALGIPLAVSDIPVLREVAGDAAIFAPPGEIPAWTDALKRVLDDDELRADLIARGHARRAHFDWRRTASATAAVWMTAAGRSGETYEPNRLAEVS
ncbi:MAG: glycosyltransferase family 1 protein [Acidobacteriota bacterium]